MQQYIDFFSNHPILTAVWVVLFVMLIALVIYVFTLDNAMLGVKFFLIPEFDKLTGKVLNGALAQACFSLSLAMGILIT